MKDLKFITISVIILCIVGIMYSFAGMQLSREINKLKTKVNEIYFTQDYLEFVKAEGRI